jgi:hypothetical protein
MQKHKRTRARARTHTGSGFIDVVGIDIVGAFTNGMEGSLTPYGFVCDGADGGAFTNGMEGSLTPYGFVCCDGANGGAVASPVTLATWRMMLCVCVG